MSGRAGLAFDDELLLADPLAGDYERDEHQQPMTATMVTAAAAARVA